MLWNILRFAVWALVLCVVAVTLLPFVRSYEWWIRMWDFPRLQILAVALLLIPLSLYVLRSRALIAVPLLIACGLYQAKMIYPYSPLANVEIALTPNTDRPAVTLLAANVLMENDQHHRVADLIAEVSPDVVFLMETDQRWIEALAPTLAGFDTVLRHPLENYYGLVFASNLEVISAKTVFLSEDETPTLLAELRSPDGNGFYFIGLHPRPPVPGNDTDERDAQIKRAATLAHHTDLPVISMGDFNDVAWSWTAKRFKHHGGFLDPRVGRGMLTSFDAEHPILRFPIDQLYLSEGFELISFERRRAVGSDHFPMSATVAITGDKRR